MDWAKDPHFRRGGGDGGWGGLRAEGFAGSSEWNPSALQAMERAKRGEEGGGEGKWNGKREEKMKEGREGERGG